MVGVGGAGLVNWPEDIRFHGEDRYFERHVSSSRPYLTPLAWRGFGGWDALNSGGPKLISQVGHGAQILRCMPQKCDCAIQLRNE